MRYSTEMKTLDRKIQAIFPLLLLFTFSTVSMVAIADSAPQITILQPAANSLFHDPVLRLHATAIDDGGPVKLRIYRLPLDPDTGESGPPILVALGTNDVDTSIDVTPFSGQVIQFRFLATDSAFQESSVVISGEVSTNAALTPVLNIPGRLVSINSEAVLYVRTDHQTSNFDGNQWLVRRNRKDGSDEDVANITDKAGVDAHVTPTGALYAAGRIINNSLEAPKLYEFDHGTTTVVEDRIADYLEVAGQFAVWNEGFNLLFRDLIAKTNALISTNSAEPGVLLDTGELFYTDYTDHQIHRFFHGVQTGLTSDSKFHFPIGADATNVLDKRSVSEPADGPPVYSVVLITPTGEVVLKEENSAQFAFAAKDGYVAFEKRAQSGHKQVWERLRDGTQIPISSPDTDASLIELGPRGQLLFADGLAFFSTPGSEPLPLDPAIFSVPYGELHVGFVDGELSVTTGGSLYRVNPYTVAITLSTPRFANGSGHIGVRGQVGQSFVVQQSSDLDEWSDLLAGVFSNQSEIAIPISFDSPTTFFRSLYR